MAFHLKKKESSSQKETFTEETPRNLKHYSRIQLAAKLVDVLEENEQLKAELAETRKQLEEQRLVCEQTGNLAEASLQLSGIFEAAQKAADLYLNSLKGGNGDASWPAGTAQSGECEGRTEAAEAPSEIPQDA